eukprot:3309187-Rhodomonas_salina.2
MQRDTADGRDYFVLNVGASDHAGLKQQSIQHKHKLTQSGSDVRDVCNEAAAALRSKEQNLHWVVCGRTALSLQEELSKGPPPVAKFDAMAKAVSQGRTELLFVYSGQGAKLDGWWLD